jgi:hypothetical protein
MRIPEFTAEASLRNSRGQYQAQVSVGSVTPGSVQAQHLGPGCWCTEWDWPLVGPAGHREPVKTCLQWFCPPKPPPIFYGDGGPT